MEFNLSELLDKKEIDIRLGDDSFTGVITAYVVDLVQSENTKKIQQLFAQSKIKMSKLGKAVEQTKLDQSQLFAIMDNLDIDISKMLDEDVDFYKQVVQAFFGDDIYAKYEKVAMPIGLALVNKRVYEVIIEQMKKDSAENAKDDNEKNE